jgi:hypothetical protein
LSVASDEGEKIVAQGDSFVQYIVKTSVQEIICMLQLVLVIGSALLDVRGACLV